MSGAPGARRKSRKGAIFRAASDGRAGIPGRKPPQPTSFRACNCRAVSTPSATTSRDEAAAERDDRADDRRVVGSCVMLRTNLIDLDTLDRQTS